MYNINYNKNFRNGYKAAMDNLTIPTSELGEILRTDEEWTETKSDYQNIKNELLQYLPEDKKHLLEDLEVSKRKQSNRSLRLMYENARDKKPLFQ